MLNRRGFLLGAGALSACIARGAPPIDFEYVDLVANRSQFQRVIHLSGDSIFRGRGLGVFADAVSPSHPLFRFRSIASMANWALECSGSADRFAYMFPLPDHGAINADDIRGYVRDSVIRAGDVVTLEDAGDHNQDPDAYEAFWDRVRAAVTDTVAATCVMMDMFDFPAPGNLAERIDFQYDRPFGTRTMNEATRAAATKQLPYPGQTILLPMRQVMTDYRTQALVIDGFDPFDRDGVHARVWAQMKMAGELAKATGALVTTVQPLIDCATANVAALRYGSATMNAARAEHYVRDAFL